MRLSGGVAWISVPTLSLGATSGSLLERIRRLAEVEANPRVGAGGLLGVALVALMLIGAIAMRNAPAAHRIGVFAMFLALAALTHLAADLPVHVDDAHRHLWPLSDWKFISPVSYWDPGHHGTAFSIFEALLGVVLCVILLRRFESWLVRVPLILLVDAYVLVPLYFTLQLGGA